MRSPRRRSLEHRKVRGEWFAQARKDLTNLPLALTDAIEDRDERIALRKTLQQQTARRLEQLEQLAQVQLSAPNSSGASACYQRPRPSSQKTPSLSG